MNFITKLVQFFTISFLVLLSQQVQAKEGDVRFYIEEITVKPAEIANYYQAVPKIITMMKKYDYRYTTSVITTNDGRYLWFTPAPQFAVMDDMLKHRDEIYKKMKPEELAIFAQVNDATATSRSYFTNLSSELSYFSADENKDSRYFKVDTYKFKPGSNALVNELGKKYVQLHEKLGIAKDYYIYRSSVGLQSQQVFLVRFAKDPVDLAKKLTAYNKKVKGNAEADKLRKQLTEMMVSMESYTGRSPEGFQYKPSQTVAGL